MLLIYVQEHHPTHDLAIPDFRPIKPQLEFCREWKIKHIKEYYLYIYYHCHIKNISRMKLSNEAIKLIHWLSQTNNYIIFLMKHQAPCLMEAAAITYRPNQQYLMKVSKKTNNELEIRNKNENKTLSNIFNVPSANVSLER